jgi:hypothetical protein
LHQKVFLKLKNPKTPLSSGQIYKKPQKKQKNHWTGFFQPCLQEHSVEEQLRVSSLLEQLNAEDLLLHALSFLRAFLGTVPPSSSSLLGLLA